MSAAVRHRLLVDARRIGDVFDRGQMTVYLRLLDVPVPSIYGPTADESWQSQGFRR